MKDGYKKTIKEHKNCNVCRNIISENTLLRNAVKLLDRDAPTAFDMPFLFAASRALESRQGSRVKSRRLMCKGKSIPKAIIARPLSFPLERASNDHRRRNDLR